MTYSIPAGTILAAGPNRAMTVTVAGTDDYNPATKTVSITFQKAHPAFAVPAVLTITLRTGSVTFRLAPGPPPRWFHGHPRSPETINVTLRGVSHTAAILPSRRPAIRKDERNE